MAEIQYLFICMLPDSHSAVFQIASSTSTHQEPLGCLKLLLLCTAGREESCSWQTDTQETQLLALLIHRAFMCTWNLLGNLKTWTRVQKAVDCFYFYLLWLASPSSCLSGTTAWQLWCTTALEWHQMMSCMTVSPSTTLQVKLLVYTF